MAPAFERRKQHEEVGGAVALVLIIEPCRAPHLHRERYARFGNQLLGGLVQTNQRAIGIAWPCINGQHVFHRRYARPIVLSLARSTMSSSTTLVSNSRKVQRARPLGGLEHARAISLASFSPSKIRATAGVARCLRLNTASKPSSTSCLRTR